jgi:hypothetical protein
MTPARCDVPPFHVAILTHRALQSRDPLWCKDSWTYRLVVHGNEGKLRHAVLLSAGGASTLNDGVMNMTGM